MTSQPAQYTSEVQAALAQRAALNLGDDAVPVVAAGHVRYHVAVEETLLSGVAPPKTVAATLRALADQLDPPRPQLR